MARRKKGRPKLTQHIAAMPGRALHWATHSATAEEIAIVAQAAEAERLSKEQQAEFRDRIASRLVVVSMRELEILREEGARHFASSKRGSRDKRDPEFLRFKRRPGF